MKHYLTALLALFFLSSFQEDKSLRWDYSKENWTPLMKAIYDGNNKLFTKLIKNDNNLNYVVLERQNFKLTALEVAIRKNNEFAVEKLLKTKQFTELNDYLITACGQNSVKILKLLIDYGANPNYILENGYTPIFAATKFGSAEVLTELLKRSNNVNRQTGGCTALMLAARDLNVDKVKILLSNGADKTIQDRKGKKAIDYPDARLSKKENKLELINQIEELLK